MGIQATRHQLTISNRKLERARKLYVRLIREDIKQDMRGDLLRVCAHEAIQRGLWSDYPKGYYSKYELNHLARIMTSILKRIHKADNTQMHFREWCQYYGWEIRPQHVFRRTQLRLVS